MLFLLGLQLHALGESQMRLSLNLPICRASFRGLLDSSLDFSAFFLVHFSS